MIQKSLLLIGSDGSLNHTMAIFTEEGWNVITAQDLVGVLDIVRSKKPEIIILDTVLPGVNGRLTCRDLRKVTDVPIFLLADTADPEELIKSLDMGADGYMAKPFSYRELTARIKALQRRFQMQTVAAPRVETTVIEVNEMVIDLSSHHVAIGGVSVRLSRIEFNLLSFLVRFRGMAFSREALLEKIWGYDYDGDARTIDTHIWSLRQKIEADRKNSRHIVAVRGVGYKFE